MCFLSLLEDDISFSVDSKQGLQYDSIHRLESLTQILLTASLIEMPLRQAPNLP